MNNRYVSTNADISIRRSRFGIKYPVKMAYFHGYLNPIGSPMEVLPADTWKLGINCFTRMSTPIVPFIDNVRQEVDVFFVPKRIIWNKTKLFYGEAEDFGVAEKIYEPFLDDQSDGYPRTQSAVKLLSNLAKCESFDTAFGICTQGSTGHNINVLPIRAFLAVYNEYFRDENYQSPYVWDKDETGQVDVPAYIGDDGIFESLFTLPQVNKDRDILTSLLPWAQKGDPVSLSLSDNALIPVVTSSNTHYMGSTGMFFGTGVSGTTTIGEDGVLVANSSGFMTGVDATGTLSASSYKITGSNLYADVSQATTVTINNLLYALAYNDFLARAAHMGTRYREYIYSMFGVKTPDLSADVPEYLGRLKFNINVNQVVQTTGFSASSSTTLGALGAYSVSGRTGHLATKSFTEPGYLVWVTYTKHQRTYSTGMDMVFNKTDLLDYYQTPFANIPDMPIDTDLYWVTGPSTLGSFQEPWFDYRAGLGRVYGMMNPQIDTLGEIWTLAEKWASKPTINGAFMIEDRNAIIRALSTGENGPDYIMDFEFDCEVTRAMPLYSSGTLEKF